MIRCRYARYDELAEAPHRPARTNQLAQLSGSARLDNATVVAHGTASTDATGCAGPRSGSVRASRDADLAIRRVAKSDAAGADRLPDEIHDQGSAATDEKLAGPGAQGCLAVEHA